MSFHPNDVARRARAATMLCTGALVLLTGAFFRTQILGNKEAVLQAAENRLREIPIAAPRGLILDRNGKVIAENVVGYTVSVLAQSEDSLRSTLRKLANTIPLPPAQAELAVRRYRRARTRPAVILNDASFDVVSVLEEHRVEYPNLIIMSAPKRFYPAGPAVQPIVGYPSEINEQELALPEYASYKAGQQIGKAGLEKQYEAILHGSEGSRYVEVDARGRVVREQAAEERRPEEGGTLQTNIDLDLQLFTADLFGDSLVGGAVAMDPETGAVLALYSAPTYDVNRFVGGISASYFDSLRSNKNQPLYNKAVQGSYPPGSTWKLATAVMGLQENIITPTTRMPQSCSGYYFFGNRPWRCWEKGGHGSLDLTGAIARSCDVYFYQLGLKLGISRLVAGGITFGFGSKTGIDLPEEFRPRFPDRIPQYFDRKWGAGGWTPGGVALNMSIGQGDNAQTVVNMARFYSALASDGYAAKPEIVRRNPERTKIIDLPASDMKVLRNAMIGVTTAGGTAASAQLQGVALAGKTGTSQTAALGKNLCDHAWFAGFAPAENPKIVVAVVLECGGHGYLAARVASAIVGRYLGVTPLFLMQTQGD
jgi:penicillin-binding protein 2